MKKFKSPQKFTNCLRSLKVRDYSLTLNLLLQFASFWTTKYILIFSQKMQKIAIKRMHLHFLLIKCSNFISFSLRRLSFLKLLVLGFLSSKRELVTFKYSVYLFGYLTKRKHFYYYFNIIHGNCRGSMMKTYKTKVIKKRMTYDK